jgi:hypothetical protein
MIQLNEEEFLEPRRILKWEEKYLSLINMPIIR